MSHQIVNFNKKEVQVLPDDLPRHSVLKTARATSEADPALMPIEWGQITISDLNLSDPLSEDQANSFKAFLGTLNISGSGNRSFKFLETDITVAPGDLIVILAAGDLTISSSFQVGDHFSVFDPLQRLKTQANKVIAPSDHTIALGQLKTGVTATNEFSLEDLNSGFLGGPIQFFLDAQKNWMVEISAIGSIGMTSLQNLNPRVGLSGGGGSTVSNQEIDDLKARITAVEASTANLATFRTTIQDTLQQFENQQTAGLNRLDGEISTLTRKTDTAENEITAAIARISTLENRGDPASLTAAIDRIAVVESAQTQLGRDLNTAKTEQVSVDRQLETSINNVSQKVVQVENAIAAALPRLTALERPKGDPQSLIDAITRIATLEAQLPVVIESTQPPDLSLPNWEFWLQVTRGDSPTASLYGRIPSRLDGSLAIVEDVPLDPVIPLHSNAGPQSDGSFLQSNFAGSLTLNYKTVADGFICVTRFPAGLLSQANVAYLDAQGSPIQSLRFQSTLLLESDTEYRIPLVNSPWDTEIAQLRWIFTYRSPARTVQYDHPLLRSV